MTEYTRENMPDDLRWWAENVSEWPKYISGVYPKSGVIACYVRGCGKAKESVACEIDSIAWKVNEAYTRDQWQAARQTLGLDKQFCNYPDCKCPIDKTTVCAMGLPTEAEEEAWREKEKQHLGSMATMRGPDHCRKQLRYQSANGEDWIDEFARTSTVDEFRGAMKFTIGKYNRRAGKKDELIREIEKMRDYCDRWIAYEESLK